MQRTITMHARPRQTNIMAIAQWFILTNASRAKSVTLWLHDVTDTQLLLFVVAVQQLNSASRGFVVSTSAADDTANNSSTVAVQLVEETARRRQLRLLKNKYDMFNYS